MVATTLDALRHDFSVGTLLFTDIEDSTARNRDIGDEAWLDVLSTHHAIIREHCNRHGGALDGEPQGDGFLYVFADCDAAVEAATAIQRSLRKNHWPTLSVPLVRIGIHTGLILWRDDTGYGGVEINRANRVMTAAHGGQVLLSDASHLHLRENLPAGTGTLDIGTFRLKGFEDEPERLHELVIDGIKCTDHPNVTSAAQQEPSHERAPLIGRDAELHALCCLLDADDTRLITLVGPGGVGKTRLATEVLGSCPQDQRLFVDLSKLDEPSLLASELLAALGLIRSQLIDPMELISKELDRHPRVIVLDNFEQIVDAADVVAAIASGCGRSRIIVTCRSRLGVPAEHVIEVTPLSLCASPTERLSPAAQLFVATADRTTRSATPQHLAVSSVERICALVEGLPLAIELAASRVDLIGLDQLDRALDQPLAVLESIRTDRPTRHRSISDTIAWSFDLLPDEAQQTLLALSPLPGGCDTGEIALLCQTDPQAAYRALEALVDAHLVTSSTTNGSTRHRMPRLVREFGLAELVRRGQLLDTQERIAELLCRIAAEARSVSHSREQAQALERLDDELDNIRALLGWGLTPGPLTDSALQVASELVSYWWIRHPDEGFRWLQRLIEANELTDATTTSRYLARALVRAAFLASWRGETDAVIDYATRGIEVCRALGRLSGTLSMGLHLRALAWAAIDDRRHWRRARRSLRECQRIDRSLSGTERAIHHTNVGDVYLADGKLAKAAELYQASLEIFESQGEAWFRAAPMSRLGEIALRQGRLADARSMLSESVLLWRSAGSRAGTPRALAGLARVNRADGRLTESHQLTIEAWSTLRAARATGEAPWVVASLAALLFDSDDVCTATRLLGGAAHLAGAYGQPVMASIRAELSDVHDGCRHDLGPKNFERHWNELASTSPSKILAAAAEQVTTGRLT